MNTNIKRNGFWSTLILGITVLLFNSHCAGQDLLHESPTRSERGHPPSQNAQPNVLVFLTDDQGWGDLSCHGNTNLSTPNIDALAHAGARFDRFYVCPVCSPTRAEFLTGRYHPRTGVSGVSVGKERLNLDERLIAEDFQAAGYATACFGKWHNGSQYPYHPIARGFDSFYGFCSGHWGDYFAPMLDQNGTPVRGNGYLVDDLTNRAIKFVEANANNPFFLLLTIPTPHTPMQVPDNYWQRFKDKPLGLTGSLAENRDFTRAALAMVENIDENVGRILAKLDSLDMARDTIVVYFSDNGPNNDRWNGDMKGRKGSTDEGGVRSPLFIRWPGQIPPDRMITSICGAVDLYPTLTELAHVPIGSSKPLDGVSLVAALQGQADSFSNDLLSERAIFSHWNGQTSVRTQQYRLDSKDHLFDMMADPGQSRNVAEDFPEVTQELVQRKAVWLKEVFSESTHSHDRPFPVGHPDFHSTQLPARDGIAHGSIKRSATAPNSSYFTNWIRTQDSITWYVEVIAPGQFEIEVQYACPESAVGTQVQIEFQNVTLQATVKKPNDAPLIGAANDRVPRTSESYLKDFQPLPLGSVQLPKGIGQLELTAPAIAGASGIEVHGLTLRRVPQ